MEIRVSDKGVRRALDTTSKQVPYATALALTAVAKQAAADVTATLPSVFDRPTPFTMRAMVTTAAKKNALVATVNVRPQQAAYLAIQETGGVEAAPAGHAFVVPVDAPRNSYGNLAAGYLQRAKGRSRNQAFVGVEKGIAGFWLRTGKGLKLLAEFVQTRRYKARFHYHQTVAQSVQASLPKAISDAVAKALATAKK